jgi:hypothetical protein
MKPMIIAEKREDAISEIEKLMMIEEAQVQKRVPLSSMRIQAKARIN